MQHTAINYLSATGAIPARAAGAPADDEALAAAARHDRLAYAELYRRHGASVYRYLLFKVGNVQDAQDLTAQTFLAGLENIGSFQGRGRFTAWLFGIARRKAMDYFRTSRAVVSFDRLRETPHPDQQPDEACQKQLDYEDLAVAMRRLTPDRAEALVLRVFADRPVSEVAELMGKSEPAVRMLVSRAIQDLRRALAEAGHEDHD